MDIEPFLTLLVMALLALSPPIAVWRAVSRPEGRHRRSVKLTAALLAPGAGGYCFTVLIWLFQFQEQCGGWLGETYTCSFGRYAIETAVMAALTLATPASLGVLLGLAVLGIRLLGRGHPPT